LAARKFSFAVVLRAGQRRLPLFLLFLAVVAYAWTFSVLTVTRLHAFEARAFDMGNLHQTVWNTAQGDWFRITNQERGLTNRLGYHVEPILLPIALIYRLYPAPERLLVLQAAVVALGALPLFALARQRGLGDWLGLVFASAYLLNPTIQAANWLEFHPVTLVPTFLMAAFYFLVAGRTVWFVGFALLAAACKEEIGLLVAMQGLYAVWVLRRPRLGLVTALLAGGWSLLAVLGIQATVAGGNIHWGRYAYLGEGTVEKVVSLVTRPDLVWAQLERAAPLRYGFELLLPVGFVALLAPELLFLALPSLAINLLADFAPMHQVTTLIYAAPVVPFVLLATVMGVARAQRASHRALRFVGRAAPLAVLGGALVGQQLWGWLPGGGNSLALEVTDHHRKAQAVLAQIPPEAAVSAQDRLNPHVSGRRTLYLFPRVEDADYVLLDATASAWPQHPSDLRRTVDELLAGDFGVAAAEDGYLLLQRGAAARELPPAFFSAWQVPPEGLAGLAETEVLFGDEQGALLALRGYAAASDRYGELVVTLLWEALRPLEQELHFYIAYLDPQSQPFQESQFYPPPALLWYPTTQWEPGRAVKMQTLPWRVEDAQFGLAVGVFAGEGGWAGGKRLDVVHTEPSLPVWAEGSLVRLAGFARQGAGWAPIDPAAGEGGVQLEKTFVGGLQLEAASWPDKGVAGQELPVTLYWRATERSAADSSIFVQLHDAAGNNFAQWDGAPADAVGQLPVSAWPPGWRGRQELRVSLPDTLPAGEYSVVVGMYDWQSGVRLRVAGEESVVAGRVGVTRTETREGLGR
jgi:uncharacterized membrane protein